MSRFKEDMLDLWDFICRRPFNASRWKHTKRYRYKLEPYLTEHRKEEIRKRLGTHKPIPFPDPKHITLIKSSEVLVYSNRLFFRPFAKPFPVWRKRRPVYRYKLRTEIICEGGYVAEVWL